MTISERAEEVYRQLREEKQAERRATQSARQEALLRMADDFVARQEEKARLASRNRALAEDALRQARAVEEAAPKVERVEEPEAPKAATDTVNRTNAKGRLTAFLSRHSNKVYATVHGIPVSTVAGFLNRSEGDVRQLVEQGSLSYFSERHSDVDANGFSTWKKVENRNNVSLSSLQSFIQTL